MSIQSNYVNPLATQNKDSLTNSSLALQKEKSHELEDLQAKQQALQNQMLLLKSSSNDATISEKVQKSLEQELEKLSAEIQTAKSQAADNDTDASFSIPKLNFDTYEKGTEDVKAGVYRVEKDNNGKERVVFDSPSTLEKNESASMEQLPNAKPESDNIDIKPKQSDDEEKKSVSTINTDKVEQEIDQLNEKRNQIKLALRNVQDDDEKKDLENQLLQIEAELRMKDNDTYKKQHATYS